MVARTLIFDLDGTIWDSASWFASGLADDPQTVARARSELANGGNIVRALSNAGLTKSRLIRAAQSRSGQPPIFAGMTEAIEELSQRGTRLAVATSLPGTLAIPMLQACGLEGSFEAVVHAGICRVAKPDPRSILVALRLLGEEPTRDAVYVGDRNVDRVAAERAGVGFAWMSHGYETPPDELNIVPIAPPELLEL